MKRIILALLAVPSLASSQASEGIPVVTLAEARQRSVRIDPDAVAARSRVDIASSERRAAYTNLITPNLRATTTYTHFSEPFFNFGTGGITTNSASATFDASYSVLGFGKFETLKTARASLASAEALETATRFRTTLETDAAYFAVLADKELSRVAADRLRRAEEQLAIARVRVAKLRSSAFSTRPSMDSAVSRITSEISDTIRNFARSSIRFSRNDKLFERLSSVRFFSTSATS